MEKANGEIRSAAKSAGVHHWQIAEELGMSEYTLVRMLRHELNEEQRNRIFKAIEKLGGQK